MASEANHADVLSLRARGASGKPLVVRAVSVGLVRSCIGAPSARGGS